jgi:hypothetical protein
MGNTTAHSPRPKISSKRSLPTCFIVFLLSLQIFFDPATRIESGAGLMEFDRRLLRSVREFRNVNRNLPFDFRNASGSYTRQAVHDTGKGVSSKLQIWPNRASYYRVLDEAGNRGRGPPLHKKTK